jgi:hypothetical protein
VSNHLSQWTKRATVASIAVLTMFCAVAGLAASSAAASPTLTEVSPGSGVHGYPYDAVPTSPIVPGAPFINLGERGYAEREFTMSGTANVYRQSGFWSSDGKWNVAVSQPNVPYTTRLLVRYPTNPAKFNGTVVVEWLNDTTGGDQDPVWSEIYNQALNQGYAYIGVTAQATGVKDLKRWDPSRYGSLSSSSDGQSYDIFTQTAQAAAAKYATLLGGLKPTAIIGAGDSQSAFRVDTYVNAFQPLSKAYNAFIGVGRYVGASPLAGGLVTTSPLPAFVRSDNTTPFIQLNTEGDEYELAASYVRQSDTNSLRTWELPGAAHIDAHEAEYELATIAREQPTLPPVKCTFGIPVTIGGVTLHEADNMPLFELENAALADMQKWLTKGVAPPKGASIATNPWWFNTIFRDQYGNALGGTRLPDIQVPTETYSAINVVEPETNLNVLNALNEIFSSVSGESSEIPSSLRASGLCLLSGFAQPFSHSTLQRLYPTHSSYVSKFTAAAKESLAAGFLTPEDYATTVAKAEAAPVP